MESLPLANSTRPAIVNVDIYEKIKDRRWRLIKVSNGAVYVGWKTHKAGKDVTVYLHRLVMGEPKGMVDHISGDIFDCQRSNLRVVTNSQNQMNSKKRAGTSSQYKNVYWNKRRGAWKAQIAVDRETIILGYFAEERPAAEAAELSRPALHGEHARSNFSSAEIASMCVDA